MLKKEVISWNCEKKWRISEKLKQEPSSWRGILGRDKVGDLVRETSWKKDILRLWKKQEVEDVEEGSCGEGGMSREDKLSTGIQHEWNLWLEAKMKRGDRPWRPWKSSQNESRKTLLRLSWLWWFTDKTWETYIIVKIYEVWEEADKNVKLRCL